MNKGDIPFPLLSGELLVEMSQTSDGLIALTNYRVYIENQTSVICNIPLAAVETAILDRTSIVVTTRYNHVYKTTFALGEKAQAWIDILMKRIAPSNFREAFAFAYFLSAVKESQDKSGIYFDKTLHDQLSPFYMELKRLRFSKKHWRVTHVNRNFELCASYPQLLLVPQAIGDSDLLQAAAFRASGRIPIVVWRHPRNGAVLIRSSQPLTGVFRRCVPDEDVMKFIRAACARDSNDPEREHDAAYVIKIRDLRDTFAVVGNCLTGGGTEGGYYADTEIYRMGLPNIHSVRSSLISDTEWYSNLSKLLATANHVVEVIEKEGRPVLLHCSDGWDRTPQVGSLALLMLDPFYRTIAGFRVLIEREWRDFGHKFGDRYGSTGHTEERSPIFLQWLHCVYQLLLQNPTSFEFGDAYLQKMAVHLYSNLFGTFLGNNVKEREEYNTDGITFGIWPLLREPKCRNSLYVANDGSVLVANTEIRWLFPWNGVTQPQPFEFPGDPPDCDLDLIDLNSVSSTSNGHCSDSNLKTEDEGCSLTMHNGEYYSSAFDHELYDDGTDSGSSPLSASERPTRKKRTISEELFERFVVDDGSPTTRSFAIIPEEKVLMDYPAEMGVIRRGPLTFSADDDNNSDTDSRPRTHGRPTFDVDGLLCRAQEGYLGPINTLVASLRSELRQVQRKLAITKQGDSSSVKRFSPSSSQSSQSYVSCDLSFGEVRPRLENTCLHCKKALSGAEEDKVCLSCIRSVCYVCVQKAPLLPNQDMYCRLCQSKLVFTKQVRLFKGSRPQEPKPNSESMDDDFLLEQKTLDNSLKDIPGETNGHSPRA